jgi:hypothetical protein
MILRAAIIAMAILISSSATAQVVQLPSMSTFSVETSVLVPDSGAAYLGGVNRSSHWMSSRGPGWGPLGRNRGTAAGASAGGMMVRATIIDNDELDKLVLEEAAAIRAEKGIGPPDHSRPTIAVPRDSAAMSVAAIKRELAAEDAAAEAEARRDFDKALAYERAGEGALAKNYFRVAARKSKGDVKQRALEHLAKLTPSPVSKSR